MLFDDLTDVYEAMIDWPKRLANEEPFYRRLIQRTGAKSVIDVACGTGLHAAMLHGRQLRVEGADVSPRMIQQAQQTFGCSDTLRWVVRSFDRPVGEPGTFDLALCVGNSLALAGELEIVRRAIREMFRAVRDGGSIVVHVLNLWRLPDGPCVWQKCRRTALAQGEVLITKGVHRCGGRGYVDLVVAALDDGPQMRSESVPFLGLEAEQLDQLARQSGAEHVSFTGGYQEQPYDRQASTDLVMVAEKRSG
jgi:SAM-dependent methyltransferase